jgi:hypothetical protein
LATGAAENEWGEVPKGVREQTDVISDDRVEVLDS